MVNNYTLSIVTVNISARSITQESLSTSIGVEVGCQTDTMKSESVSTEISPNMRSVGTQMSTGTLRDFPVRSRGMKYTLYVF